MCFHKEIGLLWALDNTNNFLAYIFLPGRRQSKTSILSTNVDQNSFETEFLIAICRPTGDKWQSKILFISIFDPR